MRKLRFDLNKHLVTKDEEQKVALPVEMELNEQKLATVTGGWGSCGSDSEDWCPPAPHVSSHPVIHPGKNVYHK